MQAKRLLERTGCTAPTLKDWLSKGVILPAQPGQGKGTHAVYDESNAAALLIALKMKEVGVVVSNYADAFNALQTWLRETSSFEWHRYLVTLTPKGIDVYMMGKVIAVADMALVAPLAPICQTLAKSIEGQRQYPMFPLHPVKKKAK